MKLDILFTRKSEYKRPIPGCGAPLSSLARSTFRWLGHRLLIFLAGSSLGLRIKCIISQYHIMISKCNVSNKFGQISSAWLEFKIANPNEWLTFYFLSLPLPSFNRLLQSWATEKVWASLTFSLSLIFCVFFFVSFLFLLLFWSKFATFLLPIYL